MKKTTTLLILLLVLIGFYPLSTQALNVKSAEGVFIPQDKVVEGNFYVAAKNITVEGVIDGDLIVAAQSINIKGKVTGDIISLSQGLQVDGEVSGNIRSISTNYANINSRIGKNVNILSNNLVIGEKADITWNVLMGTVLSEVKGTIRGELNGFTNNLKVSGIINNNINLRINDKEKNLGNNIQLSEESKINGDLNYLAAKTLNIDKNKVRGSINFTEKSFQKNTKEVLWDLLVAIFSALVLGLVIVSLFKKFTQKTLLNIEKNWNKNLLFGLLTLIITPIIAILLAITLIGLPLSIIVILLWLISLYVAKVVFGIYLGYLLRTHLFKIKKINLNMSLLLGVPLAWILFSIPVVGRVLSILSILIILGTLLNHRLKILNK